MFEMLEKFREIPNVIFFFFWNLVNCLCPEKKKKSKEGFLEPLNVFISVSNMEVEI